MKKIILLIIFIMLPNLVQAAPMKMIFLYPGGQGSQEEAQPILDHFSSSLQKASGGKITTEIVYYANKAQGLQYIQQQKPGAGILSYDVFLEKGPEWNTQVIAQTLQLPSADGTEKYYLLGQKDQTLPASGEIKIFSSRPLSTSFVTEKLFPQLKGRVQLSSTQNILGKVRALGMGKDTTPVLLDAFEYHNISRLKTAWAGNLKPLLTSPEISTAPFVVFTDVINEEQKGMLQKSLLKLSQDPSAQETLNLLRLKGFSKP